MAHCRWPAFPHNLARPKISYNDGGQLFQYKQGQSYSNPITEHLASPLEAPADFNSPGSRMPESDFRKTKRKN